MEKVLGLGLRAKVRAGARATCGSDLWLPRPVAALGLGAAAVVAAVAGVAVIEAATAGVAVAAAAAVAVVAAAALVLPGAIHFPA